MGRKLGDACSFCGKTQDKVSRLIAGPGVFICNDCVALCNEIINEKPPTASMEATAHGSVRKGRRLSGRWLGRWFRAQELLRA